MSDLLDLLVFLGRCHEGVILLGKHAPLALNDLPDLVLLVAAEADLTLIQQRAQKLTSFDLFLELALANV